MTFSILWSPLLRFFKRGSKFDKSEFDSDILTSQIKYHFRDESLLYQALKHRSYLTCSGEKRLNSNERLELLGDAVLGLLVTEFLYFQYPDQEEGTLTHYKSLLVNSKVLSQVGREFGVGDHILLNESEAKSGGRQRESILADTIEAIIGAIYLDGGLDAVRRFITEHITSRLDPMLKNGSLINYKSILQEYCQRMNFKGPNYSVENMFGPDHDRTFTVAVTVNGRKQGYGKGRSKKKAEQNAAREALVRFKLI